MASAVIGAAVIRILPSTTGFAGKVRREAKSAAQGASRPFRDLAFNVRRQITGAFSAGLASLNRVKTGVQSLGRFFARNFTIPLGIALGGVIKLTTEFEAGMLRVEALTTGVGDNLAQITRRMTELSETARMLGRTTEFTAVEASEAMQSFALAGFDTEEILAATASTLSLASAGQVELAEAADITSIAIRAFNLEARDAGRVADVLTQTFTNSNTDLTQLAASFKFVAPVAAAAGLTFEETTAALGVLSNAGLKACYDRDTQVLTRNGFVRWQDVSYNTEFATVNPETHQVEYCKPNALIRYDYKGRMYHVADSNVDLMVTPNHRMWVKEQGSSKWGSVYAGDVMGMDVNYLSYAASGSGDKDSADLLYIPVPPVVDVRAERWVDYDDEVFCADVPNHLLIVRRNGHAVVSGNSIAGTSLRGIISKLINPSAQAKEVIDELGIVVFDASDNMLPLVDIVGQFEGKMRDFGIEVRGSRGDIRDLNDILGEVAEKGGNVAGVFETITGLDSNRFLEDNAQAFKDIGVDVFDTNGILKSFNKVMSDSRVNAVTAAQAMKIFAQRAGPGMLALISQGAQSLDELTNQNLNSAGRAAQIQEKQLEGLRGAYLLLKSATEGLAIEVGLTFAGALSVGIRRIADGINVVTDFVEANQKLTSQIVKVAASLAALGPGFFFLSKIIGLLIGGLTLLLTPTKLFGLAIFGLITFFQRMVSSSEELRNALGSTFDIIKLFIKPVLALFGTILGDTTGGIDELAEAVGDRLAGVIEGFNRGLQVLISNGAIRKVIQFIADMAVKVKEFIVTTGSSGASGAFDFIVDAGKDAVSIFEALLPLIEGFIETTNDFITSDFVKSVGTTAVEALGSFLDALGAIADFIKPLTTLLGRNFAAVLVAVGAAFVILKVKAFEFAVATTTLGGRIKGALLAPLQATTTALLTTSIKMGNLSDKAVVGAAKMSVLGGVFNRIGAGARLASTGLLRMSIGVNKLSRAMQSAQVGRKALIGLTTAIAGFSLGKMIAESTNLEGKLTALGSAITNIAFAFAIGGAVVGIITTVITVFGALATQLFNTRKETFKLIDATGTLQSAYSDGMITFREAFDAFGSAFNSLTKGGLVSTAKLLQQVDTLDIAATQFGASLTELVDAAVKSDGAFEDVFDNIITNMFKLRIAGAKEAGKLGDVFDDLIDRVDVKQRLYAGGGRGGARIPEAQIDLAFDATAASAARLFEELLLLDDGAVNLSIAFKKSEDGTVDQSKVFLKLVTSTEQATGKLESLNALLTKDLGEIPIFELFGEDSKKANLALANTLLQLQEFGVEMSNARLAAEFAKPALERAAAAEEELLEVTKNLTQQYRDVSEAIDGAAESLGLLDKDPIEASRKALDTLADVQSGIAGFKGDKGFPNFAELLGAASPEAKKFRDFVESIGKEIDESLVASMVDASGSIDVATEAYDNLKTGIADALHEQDVADELIPGLVKILTEGTEFQFPVELLLETGQVDDAAEQQRQFFEEQFESRKAFFADLGVTGQFIPTGEFSPEFKRVVRRDTALAFADGLSVVEGTTIAVDLESIKDPDFLLSNLPGGLLLDTIDLEEGQIEVPAITIPSTVDLDANFEDITAGLSVGQIQEVIDAFMRGETITIPLTPRLAALASELDSEALKTEVAKIGEELGVINLEGTTIDSSTVLDQLDTVMATKGKEAAAIWAEAFAEGIDLSELDPSVQSVIEGILDPVERSKVLGLIANSGLPAIANLMTPSDASVNGMRLDELVTDYDLITTAAQTTADAVAQSNRDMGKTIDELGRGAEQMSGVVAGAVTATTASVAKQVAIFRTLFWGPFKTTVNAASSTLGLDMVLPSFHTGGIVNQPGMATSQIGSPQSGEVVARLQPGEGVLPLDAMSRIGRDQFEALRLGRLGPEDTLDPRDEIGDPAFDGMLAAVANTSGIGDSVNSISQSAIDAVFAITASSIDTMFARSAVSNLGAGIMEQAAKETAQAAFEFLSAANTMIDKIFIQKFGTVSAWPVGSVYRGGPGKDDLSREMQFIQEMQGQRNSFPALLTYLRATGTPFRVTSTIRNSLIRGTQRPSLHNVGRAADVTGLTPSVDSQQLLNIYNAFAPVAGMVRRIYSGPGGGGFGEVGSITWQDHRDHVHVALADGAVIRSRIVAELGEAGDEVVIPLDSPERAMALALQSGLFDTLARATRDTPAPVSAAGARSNVLGSTGGGPLGGGPGNTYNIVGVGIDQVKAEIAARDLATARVRR